VVAQDGRGIARTSDANIFGRTALSIAARGGNHSLLQWLLEEGGAKITDTNVIDDEHKSVWDDLNNNELAYGVGRPQRQSLLKVMVLLGDAPADFIARLSPQNADIAIRGRQIRALRPAYLEQQLASIETDCPLPTVLQSIVTTYAEPTPEDVWGDWAQWM
jgi:hypothetical protein